MSHEAHPMIHESRRLSAAELRFPNIEREALAIVYVIDRLHGSCGDAKVNYSLTINCWSSFFTQRDSQECLSTNLVKGNFFDGFRL